MPGPSIFNPWVLLALIVTFLGVAFVANHEGATNDHAKTMLAWDQANIIAQKARQARADNNQKVMRDVQAKRDDERNKNAATLERMRANLNIALNSLRDRPDRASDGVDGSGARPASAGPAQRCTGAGLYRDDAEFLTWRADAAQRIRVQRDACYVAYAQAQEAVSKFRCQ